MKITGEYQECADCRRPYQPKWPPGTPMTRVYVRRLRVYLITPHEADCEQVTRDR